MDAKGRLPEAISDLWATAAQGGVAHFVSANSQRKAPVTKQMTPAEIGGATGVGARQCKYTIQLFYYRHTHSGKTRAIDARIPRRGNAQ